MFKAKDDLKSRTEMIQELSISLDNKEKTCHRLEKKVRDLEGTLTINNEKRFKLQDTIGTMEKELQNTKAHMNQLSDSSRYEPGMNGNEQQSCRRNRNRYICQRTPNRLSQELLQASIENMDIIRRRLQNLTQIEAASSAFNGREGEMSAEGSFSESGDCLSESDLKEFIDHAHTLSEHDGRAFYTMSATQYDSPGCHQKMQIKNILIARDVVSRSLSKIRQDIENSIMLMSKDKRGI